MSLNRRVVLIYLLATALSFPILEILVSGVRARDFAHGVFDDGAVSRLGAIRLDWTRYGPVLWNAHLTDGNAYFGQFNASPIAIDGLLALLTTPFVAYVACTFLMALIAGLSMHVFLEESVQLPHAAALAGGFVYVLGFRNYGFGFSAILLPLMLWLSDRVQTWPARNLRRAAPLALGAAFLLYNFSPQPAILTSALHLGYCFVAARTGAERRSRIVTWAMSWGLALALYGPVLFTLLQLVPDSERAVRSAAAIPSLGADWRLWAEFYAEVLLGRPVMGVLGADLHEAADGIWYAGFVGIGVLALSAGLRRETQRQRAIGWLLLLLPVVDLSAMMLAPIQRRLGVLSTFDVTRVRIFIPFALAANVAVALGAILRARREPGGDRRFQTMACTLGAFLFLGEALICGRSARFVIRREGLWPLDAAAREHVLGWVGATLYFVVAIALAIWLLRALGRPSSRGGTWLRLSRLTIVVLLAVLALERLAYSHVERLIDNRALGSFEEALGQTPAIDFLLAQRNPESERVLMLGDRSQPNHRDHPNHLMYLGLYCADGYESVYPLRYHELFGLLTKPHLDKDPFRRVYFQSWGQRAYAFGPEINDALASLMGVRWLYVRHVPFTDAHWHEVFERGDERVYENPSAFPKGFVVSHFEQFSTRTALLGALELAPVEELRNTGFIEGKIRATETDGPDESALANVKLTVNTPDRVSFHIRIPGPAMLVETDAYVPGWKATVNGATRDIVPVDDCFRGVAVPAGDSDVSFSYVPSYTYAGGWVALGATATVGLLLLPARKRRERRLARVRSLPVEATGVPRRILVIVPNLLRDLDGHALVGFHLSRCYGHDVRFTTGQDVSEEIRQFAPDLLLIDHLAWDYRVRQAALGVQQGARLVVLPTSGLFQDSTGHELIAGRAFQANALVDAYLAWGDQSRQILLRSGLMLDRQIRTIGCPRFDFYRTPYDALFGEKVGFLRGLGIADPSKPIIVWAPANVAAAAVGPDAMARWVAGTKLAPTVFQHEMDDVLDQYKEHAPLIAELARRHPDWTIVVKVHPADQLSRFHWMRNEAPNIHLVQRVAIRDLLFHADVLVQRASTTGNEAWLLRKPVLSLTTKRESVKIDAGYSAGNRIVSSLEEVSAVIQSYLENPGIPEAQERARQSFIEATYYRVDGRASERAAAVIHEILASPREVAPMDLSFAALEATETASGTIGRLKSKIRNRTGHPSRLAPSAPVQNAADEPAVGSGMEAAVEELYARVEALHQGGCGPARTLASEDEN